MKIATLNASFFIVMLFLSLYSCTKDPEPPVDMGYDYFPVLQGSFITYDVQAIVWDDFQQSVDTSYYQLKMVIDTVFTDNLGRESYKWINYLKTDTSGWVYEHTFAFTKTTDLVETLEGNNRYSKLAFPVRVGYTWDINAFNTQDALNAKYIDVDIDYNISGTIYSKCAIALWEDNFSLIHKKFQEEIYARNIGMIQRTEIDIEKSITGEINKGYKNVYSILEYGHE